MDIDEQGGQQGVLVLPPDSHHSGWRVVEVEADAFSSVAAGADDSERFSSRAHAVSAAFDVLTLIEEGRVPAMHEYVQASVRDFVRTLEARGYDRESAVKILMEMVERRATTPPKGAPRPSLPRR